MRYAQSSAAAIRISIFDKGRKLLDEDDDELRLEEELLTSKLELLSDDEELDKTLLTDKAELTIKTTELSDDAEDEMIELLDSDELLTAAALLTETTELATGAEGV